MELRDTRGLLCSYTHFRFSCKRGKCKADDTFLCRSYISRAMVITQVSYG